MGNNQEKQVLKIINTVKEQIGYYNSFGNSILLLLLKLILTKPDKVGKICSNSYQSLYEFNRKMDDVILGKSKFDQHDFGMILDLIDDQIQFINENPFLYHDMIDVFVNMFLKPNSQSIVFGMLKEIELPNNQNDMSYMIETLLERSSKDVSKTMDYSTTKSIRDLALKILKIDDKDYYLDPFCGYSTSLLTNCSFKGYSGYDINHEVIAVSTAIALLLGLNNFNLYINDFGDDMVHEKANKIFADLPLNLKSDFRVLTDYQEITKDANIAYLYKIIDSLCDGGMAVITTSSRTLFSTMKGYDQFRQKFSQRGLKAVVELPSLWSGTSLPTNLIVIEKGYVGDIMFVSAKDMGEKTNGQFTLPNIAVDKICNAIDSNLAEDNFSILVSRETVISSGSWMPNRFTYSNNKASKHRDIKEIDDDLQYLYNQFFENNKN